MPQTSKRLIGAILFSALIGASTSIVMGAAPPREEFVCNNQSCLHGVCATTANYQCVPGGPSGCTSQSCIEK
jgi:hypothetical protein